MEGWSGGRAPRRRRRMGLWPERRLRALQGRRGLLPADDPNRLPPGRRRLLLSAGDGCYHRRPPDVEQRPAEADQLHAELGSGGRHHSADDRGLSRGGDSVGRGDRPVRRDALAEAARRIRRHLHAVVAVLAVSALRGLRVVLAAVPMRHPRSGHVERMADRVARTRGRRARAARPVGGDRPDDAVPGRSIRSRGPGRRSCGDRQSSRWPSSFRSWS